MESIYKELRDEISSVRKDLVVEIVSQESRENPIDTGLSASNWFAARSILYKEFSAPSVGASAPLMAQSRVKKTVKGFSDNLKTPMYVINNVEYVEDLNMGTSPQAPAGFVDIAIMNALNKVLPR